MANKRHTIRTIKIDEEFCKKLKDRYQYEGDEAYQWWVIKMGTAEEIMRGSYKIRKSVAEKIAGTYQVAFAIKNTDVFENLIDNGTPLDLYWRIKIANGKGGFYVGSLKNGTKSFETACIETHIPQLRVIEEHKIQICTKCGSVVREGESKCPRQTRLGMVGKTCIFCGKPLTRKQIKYGSCDNCRKKIINSRHSYHDWGERPRFSMPKSREKHLHLGMELEMHTKLEEYDNYDYSNEKNTVAYLVRGMGEIVNKNIREPFWHFERDGSLHNGGCECISEPMTLNKFKESMPMIQDALDFANQDGGYVNGNSGIHIHIDRTYFGNHSRYASLKLAYMVEMWKDTLKIIAQRGETGYCQRFGIETDDDCIIAYEKMRDGAGHHSAVNINNSGTIELRIFKSSFDTNEIMMYLDVTSALTKMAKNIAYEKLGNCEFAEIAKYITYRETIKTMKRIGIPSTMIDEMYATYDKKHSKK